MALVLHVSKQGPVKSVVLAGAPSAAAVVEAATLNTETFVKVVEFPATSAERLRRCYAGYSDLKVELKFLAPGDVEAQVVPMYVIPPTGGVMTFNGLLDNKDTEIWARLRA